MKTLLIVALFALTGCADRSTDSGPKRAVCLIFNYDGKILTLRENPDVGLDFPGGHIEPIDSSPLEASIREVYEEVGLTVLYSEPLFEMESTAVYSCTVDLQDPIEQHPPHDGDVVFDTAWRSIDEIADPRYKYVLVAPQLLE